MRLLLVCGVMALALTGLGTATAGSAQSDAATTKVAVTPTMDVKTYLARIDQLLANAAMGTYGDLRRGASKDLESARNKIAMTLGNRESLAGIPEEDQLALQNAEAAIGAILRHNEKDRLVCKRLSKTGTRFATSECMTVAQREARSQSAGEATGLLQRLDCIPTAENPCGG